ncbi:MAG TPA: ABC transporter permease, partial [Gemmatimonadaceae bacterium]
PSFWRRIPGNWTYLLRIFSRRPEDDVDAELRFHFDERIAELTAQGMPSERARAKAQEEFGDIAAVRERLQDIDRRISKQQRRADWWEGFMQDGGYVLRSLRRSPGFTSMVAVTLALGIGANAAIFSILDRMLLRAPTGVERPTELRRLQEHFVSPFDHQPHIRSVYNYPEFRDLCSSVPDSDAITGYRRSHVYLGTTDAAPEAIASFVVGDFFRVLGVHPAVGRFFSADETRIDTPALVAVISHALWVRGYGGDASVLGKSVSIDSTQYTIIGVAPAAFQGLDLDPVDLWVPLSTAQRVIAYSAANGQPWYESRNSMILRIIVRASTRETTHRVEATATRVMRHGNAVLSRDTTATVSLAPIIEAVWPDGGAKEVTTATRLAGVAAIILLIACANVANLLLARGAQRRHEIAIRLALGVSRGRLIRQLLTESIVIALLGGAAALFVAIWGSTALRQMLLPEVRWAGSTFDLRLAAFTATTAFLAGVASGLAPALQASRPDLTNALKAGGHGGAAHRSPLRTGLLVTQAALSVVLLAVAGLFVRSLHSVEATNLGFDADQLVFASVAYGRAHEPEAAAKLPDITAQLQRIPGVERVGLAENIPMYGISFEDVFLPGRDSVPRVPGVMGPIVSYVSPDYFPATGVRVKSGRALSATDLAGSELVIVVDSAMARTFWPTETAIGKCVIVGARTESCRRVVGVVSQAHYAGFIEAPSMHFYVPLGQAAPTHTTGALAIRVAPGRVGPVSEEVRAVLRNSLGTWTRSRGVTAMSEMLAPQLHPWRLSAALFSAAGLLALIVAAVGVYSTVAYAVSQRTHELGIRVALGARAADVARLVMGDGIRVVLIGVVLGVALALAAGRLVSSLLHGVTPHDPIVLVSVSILLVSTAALACIVPAWRATRADPVEALRAE